VIFVLCCECEQCGLRAVDLCRPALRSRDYLNVDLCRPALRSYDYLNSAKRLKHRADDTVRYSVPSHFSVCVLCLMNASVFVDSLCINQAYSWSLLQPYHKCYTD